jgi:inner membrane protein
MQIPTHVLSGWCVGGSLPLTAKERLGCMLAASLADLDGICIVAGWEVYTRWHHVLGHNVFYGMVLAAGCSLLAEPGRRVWLSLLYLALFHLHLLMDYWGSGPGWGIAYLWPVREDYWVNSDCWEFSSWQNYSTTLGLLVWTIGIAWFGGPWPTELCLRRLQAEWLAWRQRR